MKQQEKKACARERNERERERERKRNYYAAKSPHKEQRNKRKPQQKEYEMLGAVFTISFFPSLSSERLLLMASACIMKQRASVKSRRLFKNSRTKWTDISVTAAVVKVGQGSPLPQQIRNEFACLITDSVIQCGTCIFVL